MAWLIDFSGLKYLLYCYVRPFQFKTVLDDLDNDIPHPVEGEWGEFGEWSECSAACGEGSRTRTRTCSNPVPAYGGAACQGESSETQRCTGDCLPGNTTFIIDK